MKRKRGKVSLLQIYLPYVILGIILVVGLYFRMKGIVDNHSFWSDEAYVASLGRDIILEKRSLIDAMKLLDYQPLNVLIETASLKIFGFSEFAARMPSVLFGTLGIVAAYLLGKRLSDQYGGLLAAFLFGFSHLNLAHQTQAKPNAILQFLLLTNLYLLSCLEENKKNIYLHSIIICFSIASTLLHFLGILIWIPYFTFLIQSFIFKSKKITYKKIILFLFIAILFTSVFLMTSGKKKFIEFLQPEGLRILFNTNNITYLRELFWKNYAFIVLPGFMGILLGYKRHRTLSVAILLWILAIIYLWTFRAFHNIRYLLPVFAVFFVYFGVFWSKVGEKLMGKKSLIICVFVGVLLYAGGNKITRKPLVYYDPNRDLYGDVQVADYKRTFALIKEKIPDYLERAIFNNVYDTQAWYLPENTPRAYFIIRTDIPHPNKIDGKTVYGSLSEFLIEKKKYKKGLLIVEDWESLLPQEIKEYAKINLKKELRVEGLPQAQGDNWPLEVYSWDDQTNYER